MGGGEEALSLRGDKEKSLVTRVRVVIVGRRRRGFIMLGRLREEFSYKGVGTRGRQRRSFVMMGRGRRGA